MTGEVGILNVGAGDTKLSFDKSNPAECIRAARIVKDMIRRGYALLVEVGKDEEGRPRYQRALDFDESACEYIIADYDPVPAVPVERIADDLPRNENGKEGEAEAGAPAGAEKPRGGRRTKSVDASRASGVAVARTAGG